MTRRLFTLLAVAALLWAPAAFAHKASDSYLNLAVDGQRIEGRWDIALRDLELAVGLDADGDGNLTWNEVRARHAAIEAYALSHLKLSAGGDDCPLEVTQQLVDSHTDGAYTVLKLRGACPTAVGTLAVGYTLLAELDPQHRGLLALRHAGTGATSTAILGPDNPRQQLGLAEPDRWSQFAEYVKQGVWHIWIGFDHILFLLSLLLPAVLLYRERQWVGREGFRSAGMDVVRVVTAFTLAHSLTLTLAALGVLALPSRLVESAIAASVIVAALNNMRPLYQRGRVLFAFGFGLLHGFGFASVLADLGLPQGALLLSLVGFNVGVELGQLAIVAVFLPLAWWLRNGLFYRRVIMLGGSAAIALVAAVWLLERALDLQLPLWGDAAA
ncbi:HupE/UreJ family protein [Massilia sp. BSC265]|uniref:HupE/UreJ family protein n=1 Tax=Massilia sp. BSC265 TaxID=1549812 RepID=UPI0004E946A6|nr:HupE/UreJ family protein [Massilia sp. BSC265]KFI08967.1 membrane protein [Massilia sp. BSC265]